MELTLPLVSLQVTMKRRFAAGDPYFETLTRQWLEGTRRVFRELPPLQWQPDASTTSR